eukprot:6172805-Pleurochrysis_carterae.AAC.1
MAVACCLIASGRAAAQSRAGSSRSLERLFQPRTPELACFLSSDSLHTGNYQSGRPDGQER